MQASGGLIGLARELAARVERAQDDFEGGFVGEFRVRVDGDAAAIVADRDRVVFEQFDLDAVGVARHGLVHGVVEHFGDEVVQRALVGAADIHAGAFAHGFQPLEHLDGGGVIGLGLGAGEKVVGHGLLVFAVLRASMAEGADRGKGAAQRGSKKSSDRMSSQMPSRPGKRAAAVTPIIRSSRMTAGGSGR